MRKHRKKQDYAEFMQWLVEQHYPQAQVVEVVQDNLNTHSYGVFYENLPCQQAHDLKSKLHFHFTPRHASCGFPPGLNMAEPGGRSHRVFCSFKVWIEGLLP